MSVPRYTAPEDVEDPYQADFGPYAHDDWFRHQNTEVRTRGACHQCGGSLPWPDYSWKFAQAGGLLEGPFCSPACYWGWITSE